MQWTLSFMRRAFINGLVTFTLSQLCLGTALADELPPITPPPSGTILGADWTPPPRGGNRTDASDTVHAELETQLLRELTEDQLPLEDSTLEEMTLNDALWEEHSPASEPAADLSGWVMLVPEGEQSEADSGP